MDYNKLAMSGSTIGVIDENETTLLNGTDLVLGGCSVPDECSQDAQCEYEEICEEDEVYCEEEECLTGDNPCDEEECNYDECNGDSLDCPYDEDCCEGNDVCECDGEDVVICCEGSGWGDECDCDGEDIVICEDDEPAGVAFKAVARVIHHGFKSQHTMANTYQIPTSVLGQSPSYQYGTNNWSCNINPKANATLGVQSVFSGTNQAVYWFSGDSYTYFGLTTMSSGYRWIQTNLHIPGHTIGTFSPVSGTAGNLLRWYVATGTTAAGQSPLTTAANKSINQFAAMQRKLTVNVMHDSGTNKAKAYYTVAFGSPINNSYITGKQGYVTIMTSATTQSVTATVTRYGSNDTSQSIVLNESAETITVSPTKYDNRLCIIGDLKNFDSSLAPSGTIDKVVKYDSSTFYGGATNRLMRLHDFLSFTGTSNYFQDESVAPPSTGYTVNAYPLSVSWQKTSTQPYLLTTFMLKALPSAGTGTILYNLSTQQSLTGAEGSFAVPSPNDEANNVVQLELTLTAGLSVNRSVYFDTVSNGTLYFEFSPGVTVVTLPVNNSLTIDGCSMRIYDL